MGAKFSLFKGTVTYKQGKTSRMTLVVICWRHQYALMFRTIYIQWKKIYIYNRCVYTYSREGNGNPLQDSCLANLMDGGAWWAAVHGVTKSRTRLSNFTFNFHFHVLEKEMATHSSVLAWRIPGTGEPGGLPSMGSHRVGHDWSDLAVAAAYTYRLVYTHIFPCSFSWRGLEAKTLQRQQTCSVPKFWFLILFSHRRNQDCLKKWLIIPLLR